MVIKRYSFNKLEQLKGRAINILFISYNGVHHRMNLQKCFSFRSFSHRSVFYYRFGVIGSANSGNDI